MKNVLITPKDLIHWFNALRELPDNERYRALDAFWSGQIDSKVWLVSELNKIIKDPSNIYIFGGWIGVLASLIFQNSSFEILKIRNIDIDPWCEKIADTLCKPYEVNDWQFKAITSDMSTYEYEWGLDPHIVINTSTEHVDQNIYNAWFDKIPKDSLIIIQGNDYFACNEHVRCSKNLSEFKIQNHVYDSLYEGELKTDMYTRYMCIWKK